MFSLLAVALFLLASAPVPSAANGNSAQDGPLLYEIETDFLAYTLLDTVEIACTVTNTSSHPVMVAQSCCGIQLGIRVYGPAGEYLWADPAWCSPIACWAGILPGEAWEFEARWDMYRYTAAAYVEEPGRYTVGGSLVTWVDTVDFEIAVPIEIMDGPAAVPEGAVVPREWGSIKGLYR